MLSTDSWKRSNPSNVLKRGFTVTRRKKDGALLRGHEQIRPGDPVDYSICRGAGGIDRGRLETVAAV